MFFFGKIENTKSVDKWDVITEDNEINSGKGNNLTIIPLNEKRKYLKRKETIS